MIKGIDNQIVVNRAAEYSKDVSAMMRRDELSNEFANRLNKTETEQDMRSVTEMEKAAQKRVNADDDERGGRQEGQAQQKKNRRRKKEEARLPSVGLAEERLLDIEV